MKSVGIEKALAKMSAQVKAVACDTPDDDEIRGELLAALRDARDFIARPLRRKKTGERLSKFELLGRWLEVCQQPVLAVSLAMTFGHDVDGDADCRGFELYQSARNIYDVAIGDAIPGPWRDDLKRAEAIRSFNEGANATAREDWPIFRASLDERLNNSRLIGYPTGLATLDTATAGTHGLTLIAGSPGTGKTSLATSLVLNALQSDEDLGVLVYYLERSKLDFYTKILCQTAAMDASALRGSVGNGQLEKISGAEETLMPVISRLRLIEYNAVRFRGLDIHGIGEDWRALQKVTGVRRLLIVIDSLRRIPPTPAADDVPIEEELHRIRLLRSFESTGENVVITCGLRKNRSKPAIEDLYGPAELGYLADQVLVMERVNKPIANRNSQPIMIRAIKCRDGFTRDIPVDFRFLQFRFDEPSAKQKSSSTRKLTVNPVAGS